MTLLLKTIITQNSDDNVSVPTPGINSDGWNCGVALSGFRLSYGHSKQAAIKEIDISMQFDGFSYKIDKEKLISIDNKYKCLMHGEDNANVDLYASEHNARWLYIINDGYKP